MNLDHSFADKRRFIIRLGKALHKYGTPAYRLEAHLRRISHALDLQANFAITPTSLTFILSENQDQQEYSHVVRVDPGDIDLGSLARVDALVDELTSGQRTLSEAIERLDDIASKPEPYHKWQVFLAYGGSAAGFALLMQANWHTALWAALLSFIACLLSFGAEKSARIASMLEPAAALLVGFLASLAAIYDPKLHVSLAILSSIIIYIPGLALTLGLSELAARHLISGNARVMDAIMLLFKLYFGAMLGVTLAEQFGAQAQFIVSHSAPLWVQPLAITSLAISLAVIFKTRRRDIIWGIICGYLAYTTTVIGSQYLGLILGTFAGAFVLGLYSNGFSRIKNLPSSIVMLLGLIMLVPGSKLYIGLNSAISGEAIIYLPDIGVQSFMTLMSLVAGLIFADVALPPHKAL